MTFYGSMVYNAQNPKRLYLLAQRENLGRNDMRSSSLLACFCLLITLYPSLGKNFLGSEKNEIERRRVELEVSPEEKGSVSTPWAKSQEVVSCGIHLQDQEAGRLCSAVGSKDPCGRRREPGVPWAQAVKGFIDKNSTATIKPTTSLLFIIPMGRLL